MGEKDHVFSIDRDLQQIFNTYSALDPSNLELAMTVFYPIAEIELTMTEKTFEDFQPVQLTVLRLIGAGYTEPEMIARLLGLTTHYVASVMLLLRGYGHVDDDCKVTEMGKQSIKSGQKIRVFNTKQLFQFDPINSVMLRYDKRVAESTLRPREELPLRIPAIDFPQSVSSDEIVKQVRDGDFRKVMSEKSGVLNTNIDRITDIKCTGVSFAKTLLIKSKAFGKPVIFAKIEDQTKKKNHGRSKYLPFSMPDEICAKRLGLSGIPIADVKANTMLEKQFSVWTKYAASDEVKKNIESSLESVAKRCRLVSPTFSRSDLTFTLGEKSNFSELNADVLRILHNIAHHGCAVCANEDFVGNILRIRVDGERLKQIALRLAEVLDADNSDGTNLHYGRICADIRHFADEKGLDRSDVIGMIEGFVNK